MLANFLLNHDVSRETSAKLQTFTYLLQEWGGRINLISPNDLFNTDRLWRRHFADCLHMAHYLPKDVDKIVDIGSGAGFPGIVLGILGLPILALEPNHKKMAFLKLVTRELRLPNVDVLGVRWDKQNVRIIDRDYLSDTKKCVLTARGLAPLQELLSYMTLLGRHKMQGFFLKGLKVVDELTYARTKWHYNHLLHQISAESYLVQIWDVEINKSHG